MVFLIITVSILLVALVLCTVVAHYLYRMAITRKGVKSGAEQLNDLQKKQRGIREEAAKWLEAQPAQDVSVVSYDGLKLVGKFLPADGARRTVICAHGFRVNGVKDFGPMIRYYHEHQSNVMLMTQRAHGDSEGGYLCYGVKERFDVQKWADLVNTLAPGLPIYLHGVSMGCATVVMASGLDLPDNVKGVIADCGYTSAWDEFSYIMKKNFHLPTFPILNIADIFCRLTAGFKMKELSTIDVLAHEKYPVLFIHGADDDFVPTYMGIANHEACASKKKLVLFEKTGHALSWTADLERYEKEVSGFFDDCESM